MSIHKICWYFSISYILCIENFIVLYFFLTISEVLGTAVLLKHSLSSQEVSLKDVWKTLINNAVH